MKTIKIIKEKFKQILENKKIALIVIIFIVICLTFAGIKTYQIVSGNILRKQLEGKALLEYEIKDKIDEDNYKILVKVNAVEGIETVKYTSQKTGEEIGLNCNGKKIVGIDYKAEDLQDYEFKIKVNGQEEKTETLHFEAPRIQGNYTFVKGVYTNEPDISGYNADYTRYLNVNTNGDLEIGNFISKEKSEDWYSYKESQWANIYVENNGLEAYYVWIPRYCYKLDPDTQRSDVKFIDVYNNYKDENGNETKWKELEEQGYQVPKAFSFNDVRIPGYWETKYTLGEKNEFTVDYEAVASKTKIKVTAITTKTSENIKEYRYYIDGEQVKTSTSLEDLNEVISEDKEYTVSVAIVGENNDIIGSMTKKVRPAKVNSPDTSGFNQETTFYVTYDENGEEHSTIPITESAPENWYDYVDSKWANIVTRNNGLETYYVWIPRYEYKLNSTSQRSYVNFLEGTSTETSEGYSIPDAFTFNGKQITGYWETKYTLGE